MVFFLVPDAKPVAEHLHWFGHSDIVYYHVIKALLHCLSHETSLVVNTPAQANANYPGKALLDKPYFQQRQMHWEFLVLWKVDNLLNQRSSSIWLRSGSHSNVLTPCFCLIFPSKIRNPNKSSMCIKKKKLKVIPSIAYFTISLNRRGLVAREATCINLYVCVFSACVAHPAGV